MDSHSTTLTIHFKNRVRLFYPKHLPGNQLFLAIHKTFDLASDDTIELVDRVSHEAVTESQIHGLAPNTHKVCTLIITSGGVKQISHSNGYTTLLRSRGGSQERTFVVHRQHGSFGFQIQYFFAPSQSNLSSPHHRMSTIFVKQLDHNGPAARVGLKQGDRILKVNGISVFNRLLDDVVHMMRKRDDYVVLTTVPWYNDYLQVEYPNYAYSEPGTSPIDGCLNNRSIESPRYSQTLARNTPDPYNIHTTSTDFLAKTPPSRTTLSRTPPSRTPPSRTPPSQTPPSWTPPSRTPPSRTTPNSWHSHSSQYSHLTPPPTTTTPSQTTQTTPQSPNLSSCSTPLSPALLSWSAPYSPDCIQSSSIPPEKPPRPDNYNVLRRTNQRNSVLNENGVEQRGGNKRRFGNLKYFEEFQLPESVAPESTSPFTPNDDPFCQNLISQAKLQPHMLRRSSESSTNSETRREGTLHCKFELDGESKRNTLRGWTSFFVTLQSHLIYFYKNYNEYVQKRGSPDEKPVDISHCLVQIEYKLMKPIFRLCCQNGKEYLLKADTMEDMFEWIESIQKLSKTSEDQTLCNNLIKKKADEILKCDSPDDSSKNKRTTLKLKSYFSEFSGANPAHDFPSFGSTIDKCLKCPHNKLVPAVVARCVKEVEERGMDVTGIYRLSGNAHAIQCLIDDIDKDPISVDFKQPPWTDISNTCAALKQFFRRLAEPLIPSNVYPDFMNAAKIADQQEKQEKLRKLVQGLPPCHYATAQLLFRHLAKVADNAENNKMHTCNLAIIFGPTVIRSADCDMVSMVADMSHQCKIVELFISQCPFIFGEEEEQEKEEDQGTEEISEMGLFNKKPPERSNGFTTPTDQRVSRQTGWEFQHVIDKERNRRAPKTDKFTQCNIRKEEEERIVYEREPIGLVHPHTDNIKMRPASRIINKKLITLESLAKQNLRDDVMIIDMKNTTRKVSSYHPCAPKKSLSLESLLDVVTESNKCTRYSEPMYSVIPGNRTQSPRDGTTEAKPFKRGCSKYFDNVERHVAHQQHSQNSKNKTRDILASVCNTRSNEHSKHEMKRENNRKSHEWSGERAQPRWVENMLHTQQGFHPVVKSQGELSNVLSSRSSRGNRWKPGQTHKWVLDNNTTLLESTL